MRWTDQLRVAGRLAAATPGRTGALALGLAVALFLPSLTLLLGQNLQDRVRARLDGAPVLLARAGDPYGLCLSTLAFVGPPPPALPWGARRPLLDRGDVQVLPLRVGRQVQGLPLVGVGAYWLSAWNLQIREGRAAALAGEVVVGATAARRLGLAPGDRVQADPDDLYDLGGALPLPLRVVGVLHDSPSPEDGALLTPVQTLWALDGALHGHAEAETGADPWAALHLHGDVD